MFTVKNISIGGTEVLYSGAEINYEPGDGDRQQPGLPVRRNVSFQDHRGDPITLYNGTVFVMNESGATVSRWDLGASMVPLRDDVDGRNCTIKAVDHPTPSRV